MCLHVTVRCLVSIIVMKHFPPYRNRHGSCQPSPKRSISISRFSLKNFSIALLVNAGLVHMSLYGSVPLTTFEAPIASGTDLSTVSTDWTVANGQAKVEPGVGFQGTQGVKISQGLDQEARITRLRLTPIPCCRQRLPTQTRIHHPLYTSAKRPLRTLHQNLQRRICMVQPLPVHPTCST